MPQFKFEPHIAEAVIKGRILHLPTLREMAEHGGFKFDDAVWAALQPSWERHAALSTEELERHLGQPVSTTTTR